MKKIFLCLIVAIMITGCVTPPVIPTDNNSTSTTSTIKITAQKWVDGAKWVMFITDIMAPTMCAAGKFALPVCNNYAAASLQLHNQLLAIEDLIVKGATPETIGTALNQAMATYLLIDAMYRGQV